MDKPDNESLFINQLSVSGLLSVFYRVDSGGVILEGPGYN